MTTVIELICEHIEGKKPIIPSVKKESIPIIPPKAFTEDGVKIHYKDIIKFQIELPYNLNFQDIPYIMNGSLITTEKKYFVTNYTIGVSRIPEFKKYFFLNNKIDVDNYIMRVRTQLPPDLFKEKPQSFTQETMNLYGIEVTDEEVKYTEYNIGKSKLYPGVKFLVNKKTVPYQVMAGPNLDIKYYVNFESIGNEEISKLYIMQPGPENLTDKQQALKNKFSDYEVGVSQLFPNSIFLTKNMGNGKYLLRVFTTYQVENYNYGGSKSKPKYINIKKY
jgi:hypothetical protein